MEEIYFTMVNRVGAVLGRFGLRRWNGSLRLPVRFYGWWTSVLSGDSVCRLPFPCGRIRRFLSCLPSPF